MPRAPCSFKQSDVTKALRAARAAGIRVGSFEIDHATGKLVIHADQKEEFENHPYDRWKAGRGQS